MFVVFFKQKTAYEMRISDWSSDVCSSDLILARQHYETLRGMASGLPVNIAILTGREKGKARESTLMGLADGSIDILVGTHAIFQDAVRYKNIALAVIDEQHRFGVSPRMKLDRKRLL